MVFHGILSDSNSSQASRTLLSILAYLSYAVLWIISRRLLIFKYSSPCINPLVIVPGAQITIGINVTFMFHDFFNSLARPRYLFFFSLSFKFTLWSVGRASSTILLVLICLLIIIRSGRLYNKIPEEHVCLIFQD